MQPFQIVTSIFTLLISIISIIMCILTFVRNGSKDMKKDTETEAYKWGRLEERLNNLRDQLDKVLDKLDGYDKEIDIKIEKAIESHVLQYHKKGD